jgi:Family of unknown function (DUF5906)/Primase C terminal 2 (PriCT-2)/Bifunctional DNA primase/polymerase, N-terminal
VNAMPPSTSTALRLALFDKGYQPIPITAPNANDKDAGKKPLILNWRTIPINAPEIRSWGKGVRARDTNTGIRTRGLLAVDIDVLDEALSDRLQQLAFDMLGETPLLRIGKAPKRLACYKSAPDVAKARTPEFFFDNGDKSLVECLSDGQQFVAFGIHPGTGKPYTWPNQSPLDVAVDELPTVDAKRIQDFLREAETILRSAGGKTAKELRGIAERPARKTAPTPCSGNYPAPIRADVESALQSVPNTHDWHGWFKIGAAIFDAVGSEGEELFASWSAQSSKDVPADTINKYRSFDRSAPTVTAASLFWEARQNGWLSERELEWARATEQAPSFEPDTMESVDEGYYASQTAVEPAEASSDEIDAVVAEFNENYLVVNENGKAVIYSPTEDPILKRRFYEHLGFEDLRRLYMNRKIQVGTNDKDQPIMANVANVWLGHRERRQFIQGVAFDPTGKRVRDGVLNLWQGFAVQPKAGSWQRMMDHIRRIVCAGNDECYNYVLNWMARLVQKPAEQGEVAIVMRGAEGTGKGTLARALKHICGQHGLHISNSKHLTGNFNAHLRDCVFLFADEAFFAGDRAHTGVLKAIITEPYLAIEGKYQNAIQAPNFLHLMMASNEDWVIPASLEARRFLVLEVSDSRRDDHDYFTALWTEMERGGYEAMLHDLLDHDLTFFNPRRVPHTEGLQTQKKLSLGVTDSWWLDVLQRGYVFQSKLGLEADFAQWHDVVTTELLFASYTTFAEKRRERRPLTREELGTYLNGAKVTAKQCRPRNKAVGEHIVDVDHPFGGIARKAKPNVQPRAWGYKLGALADVRSAFTKATGLTIDWHDKDGDEDPAPGPV